MGFVHGHPRDTGWVKSHRRAPNQAEGGQLPLIAAASPEQDVDDPDRAADQDGSEVAGRSPPDLDVRSSRKSAITRS
jgi:hypothetical protein